jgi:hypothetical protein
VYDVITMTRPGKLECCLKGCARVQAGGIEATATGELKRWSARLEGAMDQRQADSLTEME